MKTALKGILFALIVLGAATAACARDGESRLKIQHSGFNDRLDLDGNRLQHTFNVATAPRAADLQLTPVQVELFEDWLDRCQVFTLTSPDVMVAEPYHPGAQEHSRLKVDYGDQMVEISWGGVSLWNNPAHKQALEQAVEELLKLSMKLIREAGLLDY
jgi:hypothetical protein